MPCGRNLEVLEFLPHCGTASMVLCALATITYPMVPIERVSAAETASHTHTSSSVRDGRHRMTGVMLASLFRHRGGHGIRTHPRRVTARPDIRGLVQDILQDEGYQVSVAENAAAARELRRQIRPDAILLGIWMPDHRRHQPAARMVRARRTELSRHHDFRTRYGRDRRRGDASGCVRLRREAAVLAKLLLTVERALKRAGSSARTKGSKRQVPVPLEPVGSSRARQALRGQLVTPAAGQTPGCCSSGRPAAARNRSRAGCTKRAHGAVDRS